jgi:hypothetical protein
MYKPKLYNLTRVELCLAREAIITCGHSMQPTSNIQLSVVLMEYVLCTVCSGRKSIVIKFANISTVNMYR